MMKQLFESFRKFHEQEVNREKLSDIEVYKIDGLLVIAKRLGRRKTDILSDVRAIEGITTVTIEQHRNTDTLDFSELKIKIDTSPLSAINVQQIISNIEKKIQGVKGVQSFRILNRTKV